MNLSRYFDHAATTPVDPRVVREMLPFFSEEFGNPHSLHDFGRRARAAVDLARERVATLIGAEDPSQITFTSGATESNNWVIRAFGQGAFSPFEHSAVREPAISCGYFCLDNTELTLQAPPQRVRLLSVMSANNEIGSQWDPGEFRDSAEFLHSDMTQSVGKVPTDVDGLDFASFSAHKFYGPKGVGALYSAGSSPDPLLQGGDQENGARSGTVNVSAIVGMGVAAAIAHDQMPEDIRHATRLRAALLDQLQLLTDWQENGGANAMPHILSLSFDGVEGETLVIEADQAGYAISSGAACSSQKSEPSHVLRALKMPESWRRGTIRISFGRSNDEESSVSLAKRLMRTVEKLRTMT